MLILNDFNIFRYRSGRFNYGERQVTEGNHIWIQCSMYSMFSLISISIQLIGIDSKQSKTTVTSREQINWKMLFLRIEISWQ